MPALTRLALRAAILPPLALLLAADPGSAARTRLVGDGEAWVLGLAFLVFVVAAALAALLVAGFMRRRADEPPRPPAARP